MSEPVYRPAAVADRDSIVEFQLNMAQETEGLALDRAICTRGVQAVFDDASRGRYYVAEDDGQVIASLLVTSVWSDWRAGAVWWIQSVYVAQGARRRGIYTGLYNYVTGLADADPSVMGIRLYVATTNSVAQRAYTRLGMNGEHYQVFERMKPL